MTRTFGKEKGCIEGLFNLDSIESILNSKPFRETFFGRENRREELATTAICDGGNRINLAPKERISWGENHIESVSTDAPSIRDQIKELQESGHEVVALVLDWRDGNEEDSLFVALR